MKKLLMILIVIIPFISKAQTSGDNNILLTINSPLIFSYNSIDELLAPNIIHNAIELRFKGKGYNRNIMAHVNYSGARQNDIPDNWLALKLITKSSTNAIVYNTQVNLSTTPVLLFTQLPSANTNEDLSFSYDLVLNPLNTFINTGNFNFTIIISIIQP